MRKSILILVTSIFLFLVSCGGGGGDSVTSDANRFIGDWNGNWIQTGRDDGQPLAPDVALRMHIEYAGKETIGGVTFEYVSLSMYLNNTLFLTGMIKALPGGTWIIDLTQADLHLKMLGQFTGNTASGSYEMSILLSQPPYNWVKTWGTWTASK